MIASNTLDLFEAACQIIFLPKLHWTSKLDDKIGHVNKPLLAWSVSDEEKKSFYNCHQLSPMNTLGHNVIKLFATFIHNQL